MSKVTSRILFTLTAFGLIAVGYTLFETTLYLPLFVFGLLIPVGILLKVISNLRSP